ncbi:hypothetical protein SAMN04487907_105216 [Zunongwangia mangrovi]|uniref:Uncharacterized protein n=1 Tax=Zunongwangia mangrovi TaxID=1334022 RepID=A0A1I1KAU9_9FLAO|nr:hypothetical protein SAMN04487907_105216 [Zunongwangia mangrovi]
MYKRKNIKQGIKTISLTENPNWKNLINKTITKIIVLWDEIVSQKTSTYFVPMGVKKKITLPQTWQIEFGNEKLWISALELKEDGINSYWADHLTIFLIIVNKKNINLLRTLANKNVYNQLRLTLSQYSKFLAIFIQVVAM